MLPPGWGAGGRLSVSACWGGGGSQLGDAHPPVPELLRQVAGVGGGWAARMRSA